MDDVNVVEKVGRLQVHGPSGAGIIEITFGKVAIFRSGGRAAGTRLPGVLGGPGDAARGDRASAVNEAAKGATAVDRGVVPTVAGHRDRAGGFGGFGDGAAGLVGAEFDADRLRGGTGQRRGTEREDYGGNEVISAEKAGKQWVGSARFHTVLLVVVCFCGSDQSLENSMAAGTIRSRVGEWAAARGWQHAGLCTLRPVAAPQSDLRRAGSQR